MAHIDNSGTKPNKGPNFLLIVILASIAIVIILIASFFTVDWEGRRLVPRAMGKTKHPTSELRIVEPHSMAGQVRTV